MTRWLVIGKSGQLSSALHELLGERAIFVGQDELDLSQPQSVQGVLAKYTPTAVLNAAAYTQVDAAEKEVALAMAINATSVAAMAAYCESHDIPLVHISTDYVFDGSGEQPRDELTDIAPLNMYGKSKCVGEQAIADTGGKYLILRTSWVYDESGKNFLNTMLRLGREREKISVVADQIGGPTYALHLAQVMIEALEQALMQQTFPSGIYHACGAGEASWYDFARAIFELAAQHGEELAVKEVTPIATSDYPTPAQRPLNSRLDCSKLQRQFGIRFPSWQQALKECMEKKYASA